MKRLIIIIFILVVVIGLGVGGYVFLRPQTYSLAEDPSILETLTIETDTIVAEVNAAGRLEAIDSAALSFESSGKVAAIHVAEGGVVAAGTLLAELDQTALTQAVQLAELDLTRAQLELEKLQAPASAADIESAQASLTSANIALVELDEGALEAEVEAAEIALASARANLQKILTGPDKDRLVVAAANLRKTEVALREAQYAYDAVAYDSRGAQAAGGPLEQATIDYETALANYNLEVKAADNADILAAEAQVASAESNLAKLQQSVTPSQVASAQAQVTQAEANLQKLLTGPSDTDLALAQATIESAQINLAKARHNLEQASLVSPIAGVVTKVDLRLGTPIQPNTTAIEITTLATFKLVVAIDEIDISQISTGQPVTINLDALPEETFEGQIDIISPVPLDSTGGIVAYPVTILIADAPASFRVGMNVNATIETERLENVVVVPNRAIQLDRETGQTLVEKVINAQTTELTEVVLGRRGSAVSQVLEGLESGDQIIIRQRDRREELRRAIQGED